MNTKEGHTSLSPQSINSIFTF